MQVVRIENFSLDEVMSAAEFRANYEAALIFSTKYEPGPAVWDRWQTWSGVESEVLWLSSRLPPAAAAQILGGHVVFSEQRQGQWIAVIEIEKRRNTKCGGYKVEAKVAVSSRTSRVFIALFAVRSFNREATRRTTFALSGRSGS